VQLSSVREQQKRDRKARIFQAAMTLFEKKGFQETTIVDIAKAAKVSRGTVFNYFAYKEAILIEHLASKIPEMGRRVKAISGHDPVASLYHIFRELADFVESNAHLILPLSYELLNPDPERSRHAYMALSLTPIFYEYLTEARAAGRIRTDFSRERLARTLSNTYFLTALQWTAYRRDRSIHDELHKALQLMLEGVLSACADSEKTQPH
jgi:AcrR family transcriptional regulator